MPTCCPNAEITAGPFFGADIAALAIRRRTAAILEGLQATLALGFKAGIAAGIAAAGNTLKPFKGAGCALAFTIVTDIPLLLGQAVGVLAA